eukprot:m.171552 g.171552  ORF g.171552 m.171552 type:complete len:697 (-) comp13387_c0_seq1:340-2430(-)
MHTGGSAAHTVTHTSTDTRAGMDQDEGSMVVISPSDSNPTSTSPLPPSAAACASPIYEDNDDGDSFVNVDVAHQCHHTNAHAVSHEATQGPAAGRSPIYEDDDTSPTPDGSSSGWIDVASPPSNPSNTSNTDSRDTPSELIRHGGADNANGTSRHPTSPAAIGAETETAHVSTSSTAPHDGPDGGSRDDKVATTPSAPAQSGADDSPDVQLYFTRVIRYGMREVVIICQNANGPCPLLALCNVLLLRGDLYIHPDRAAIQYTELVNMLTELLLSKEGRFAGASAEYENAVQTCIEMFPDMSRGLDVNVTFGHCQGFEFTRQLQVFDTFGIKLYHGWVVDPQDIDSATAIGTLGYNQLVELVIESRSEGDVGGTTPEQQTAAAEKRQRGAAIDNWLSANPTQLTFHGLCELHSTLSQNELGIFFRNNHFFVILKRKDELLTLVTDQGFAGTSVAWETLHDVSNDSQFLTDEFRNADGGHRDVLYPVEAAAGLDEGGQLPAPTATQPPMDDAELARQLQEQENARARRGNPPQQQQQQTQPPASQRQTQPTPPSTSQPPGAQGHASTDRHPAASSGTSTEQAVMSDAQLARLLQDQEDERAQRQAQQRSEQPRQGGAPPPQTAHARQPVSATSASRPVQGGANRGAVPRSIDADRELAIRLQREEQQRFESQNRSGSRGRNASSQGQEGHKDSKCLLM